MKEGDQALYHAGYRAGRQTRYAVIVSVESGPPLEHWLQTQLPARATGH